MLHMKYIGKPNLLLLSSPSMDARPLPSFLTFPSTMLASYNQSSLVPFPSISLHSIKNVHGRRPPSITEKINEIFFCKTGKTKMKKNVVVCL